MFVCSGTKRPSLAEYKDHSTKPVLFLAPVDSSLSSRMSRKNSIHLPVASNSTYRWSTQVRTKYSDQSKTVGRLLTY